MKKTLSTIKMEVGLVVGLCFLIGVSTIIADEEGDADGIDPRKNIIAIHDSESKEYKKNCSECHADILTRQSLDSSIAPAAHVSMFPFAAGKEGDDKQCVWCHRTVDLQGTQTEGKSQGNLRKHVDATLCALCHGPSGPGQQFYQAGPSPTEPDGPALYDLVCAACHRDLENSKVDGESAKDIQKKIDEDEGGMGPLGVLSAPEIQAIADALAQVNGGDDDD